MPAVGRPWPSDDDDGDNIYYDDDGDDRQQGQLFFSAGEWCDFSLVQLIQKVGEHFFLLRGTL